MGYSITQVKNRTTADYEFLFDGQVSIVPAGEVVPMPTEMALHGIRKSIISYNHIANTAVRALVLADSSEANEIIDPRDPKAELLDRTDDPDAKKMKIQTFKNPDSRVARVSSSLDGE